MPENNLNVTLFYFSYILVSRISSVRRILQYMYVNCAGKVLKEKSYTQAHKLKCMFLKRLQQLFLPYGFIYFCTGDGFPLNRNAINTPYSESKKRKTVS